MSPGVQEQAHMLIVESRENRGTEHGESHCPTWNHFGSCIGPVLTAWPPQVIDRDVHVQGAGSPLSNSADLSRTVLNLERESFMARRPNKLVGSGHVGACWPFPVELNLVRRVNLPHSPWPAATSNFCSTTWRWVGGVEKTVSLLVVLYLITILQ